MSKKIIFILKSLFVLTFYFYILFIPSTPILMVFEGSLVLLFSIATIFKVKKNIGLFLLVSFLFYSNYSVVVGEYFSISNVAILTLKTPYYYGFAIRVLLLFTIVLFLFLNVAKSEFKRLLMRSNQIIFVGLVIVLTLVLIFGLNRSNISVYSVRITPLFEYSKLLFLFAIFYSGNLKINRLILLTLLLFYILNDFYFGGRITSLQLLVVFAMTIFIKGINIHKIILFSFVGLLISAIISTYRITFSTEYINLNVIFESLIRNSFISDTVSYSYYASVTHIAAYQLADIYQRFVSFISFLFSTFTGIDSNFSDVTSYVSKNFFVNVGGGFFPFHFYFWFGWSGVLFSGLLTSFILNRFSESNRTINILIFIAIITNTPRWYLYSPNQFFRGALIFVPLLYIIFNEFYKLTLRNSEPYHSKIPL